MRTISLLIVMYIFICMSDVSAQDSVIAVYPFAHSNDIVQSEEIEIRKAFYDEFVKRKRFTVIENDFVSVMLKELGIAATSACSDVGCLSKIGKMLFVTMIVGGTITRKNSKFIADITLVDVAEGTASIQVRKEIKADNLDQIYVYARVAANDIINLMSEIPKKHLSVSQNGSSKKNMKPKRRRGNVAAWVTATTVVVGSGVAAAYFLLQKDSDEQNETAGKGVSLDDAPIR